MSKLDIAVGGPIGVGKSTYCNKVLERHPTVKIVREIPTDKNHLIHKFLEAMYEGKFKSNNEKDYSAFAFQTYMLGYRSNNLYLETNSVRLFDRSILEDRFFANKLITNAELKETYNKMWDKTVRELQEKGCLPNGYIIINPPNEEWCLTNILKRNRECEVNDFEENKQYYLEIANEYTKYLEDTCKEFNIPYLVLDANSSIISKGLIPIWFLKSGS